MQVSMYAEWVGETRDAAEGRLRLRMNEEGTGLVLYELDEGLSGSGWIVIGTIPDSAVDRVRAEFLSSQTPVR